MSLTAGTRQAPLSADAGGRNEPLRAAEELSGVTLAPNAPTARGVEHLRALLHADRCAVGELRSQQPIAPLKASSYTTPLHVLWRRYLRAHRKSLRRAAALCLAALVLIAASYFVVGAWLEGKSLARAIGGSGSVTTAAPSNESFPRETPQEPTLPEIASERPSFPLPRTSER